MLAGWVSSSWWRTSRPQSLNRNGFESTKPCRTVKVTSEKAVIMVVDNYHFALAGALRRHGRVAQEEDHMIIVEI